MESSGQSHSFQGHSSLPLTALCSPSTAAPGILNKEYGVSTSRAQGQPAFFREHGLHFMPMNIGHILTKIITCFHAYVRITMPSAEVAATDR